MRYSKQRENIKKGLEKFCIHPTAEELYMKLKPENAKLSQATVYRNLNQLAADGDIKKIEGLSGQVHYDHNNHEHFHLICIECNKIEDLHIDPTLGCLEKLLKEGNDVEILSYDIIVKGLCSKCKDKDKAKKGQKNGTKRK